MFFKEWRERRRIEREAARLVLAHGSHAYVVARQIIRFANALGERQLAQRYSRIVRAIAEQTGRTDLASNADVSRFPAPARIPDKSGRY